MPNLLDTVYLLYFAAHIPVSILIDSQLLLPAAWFSPVLRDQLAAYVNDYADPIVQQAPRLLWLRAFVGCELAYQLPLMLLCTFGLWKGT